ncbi:PH domain-containing protein [Oceanobacillus manasiensis]|uniref:PH domain-containing protein n=1 Tax=Oceanobacillus manasiensis TaxID=586413 RepID=UPI0005A9EBB2|nr:PH domain-containing protein [Oceanobacillus manasiensis]
MNEATRHHPLLIVYDFFLFIKNIIFFIFILFIFQAGSDSWFITYGRIAFYVLIAAKLIHLILKWSTNRYTLTQTAFVLTEGVFSKNKKTIPYSKVQHVKRETKLFHRIFRVTSITFETSSQGDDSSVKFNVVTHAEASRLEKTVYEQTTAVKPEADPENTTIENTDTHQGSESKSDRVVHFSPTKKEVIKASFTSLSFLAVIPILGSQVNKFDDAIPTEQQAEGFLAFILDRWWMIALSIILVIALLMIGGMVWTFLKYGKYEIASDSEKIDITKGVLEETAFSITKKNVQAIQIQQSFMKRILGLAEVKLVVAGALGDDGADVNSLYPFLPVKKAHQLVEEILPSYRLTDSMQSLPREAFWLRMLTPSWFWITATAVLFFWKPDLFGFSEYWWVLSLILLVLVVISRIMNYKHTRYTINDSFIQLRRGGFGSSLFLSKRSRVIEVEVSRNIVQKKLGLASLETVNRAKPVLHTTMEDIPTEWADAFLLWYQDRNQEIELK